MRPCKAAAGTVPRADIKTAPTNPNNKKKNRHNKNADGGRETKSLPPPLRHRVSSALST